CSSAFHTELGNSSISDEHVFFVALHFTTRDLKINVRTNMIIYGLIYQKPPKGLALRRFGML
ncbi:hypothetical protein, partial [Streptococcus pyogenes]